MLIFNCTKAAQDFFTVTRKGQKQTIVEAPPCKDMSEDIQHLSSSSNVENPPRIQQWLLHAVSIKRKHCLVAVEVNTRFSVTLAGVKKANSDEFLELFKTYLSAQVLEFGREHDVWSMSGAKDIVQKTLDHFADVHFFQRSDRSVQARINTVVQDLRYWADEDPMLLADENMLLNFNNYQNRMLCRSKAYLGDGYINPYEEMLFVWQQLYQGATVKQVEASRQRLKDYSRNKMKALVDGIANERQAAEEAPEQSGTTELSGGETLTDSDLAFLEQMLLKYQTEYSPANLSSLHGFLTAIVSGPNMLPPSYWLPQLWGGEDMQPNWEEMGEVERFMGCLFSMMNNIVSMLMESSQKFSAMFIGDDSYTDVSSWCFGYIEGVGLDDVAWDALPNHLIMKVKFLDELSVLEQRVTGKERIALNNQVVGIAEELHAYWLKQRSPQPSRSNRPIPDNVVPIRPQQPVTSQKVGRNELCPCGSGKKFKKCCLH